MLADEGGVGRARLEDLLVAPEGRDPAPLEEEDLVDVLDRREPVRHDDAGQVLRPGAEGLHEPLLVVRVEAGGDVVEEEEPGRARDRPRYGDSLALAAGDADAALAEEGLGPLGEVAELALELGRGEGPRQGGLVDAPAVPRRPQGHVLAYRAREEEGLLGDVGYDRGQRGLLPAAVGAGNRPAPGPDPARARVEEAAEDLHQGRLARADRADDGELLALLQGEGQPLEGPLLPALVGEGDVLHLDAARVAQHLRPGGRLPRGMLAHLLEAVDVDEGPLARDEEVGDVQYRVDQHAEVAVEGEEGADADAARRRHVAADEDHAYEHHAVDVHVDHLEHDLEPRDRELGAEAPREGLAEEALVLGLAGVGLDDARPREAHLELGVDVGDRLLVAAEGVVDPVLGHREDSDEEGQGDEGEEGQLPVEDEHGHEAEADLADRLDGAEDAGAEEPGELGVVVDVVGEPRDHVAGAEGREEAEVLPHHVGEVSLADGVVADRVHRAADAGEEVGDEAGDADADHHEGEAPDRRHPIGQAGAARVGSREESLEVVEEELGEVGVGHGHRARQEGEEEEEDDEAAPLAPYAPDPREVRGLPSCHGSPPRPRSRPRAPPRPRPRRGGSRNCRRTSSA